MTKYLKVPSYYVYDTEILTRKFKFPRFLKEIS